MALRCAAVVLGSLVALTGLVAGAGAQAGPEHVHLGIPTDDPASTLSVVWFSFAPSQDAAVVVDGPDGPRTFAASLVEGPSAGFVYEATLEGLPPDTAHTYTIGERSFELVTPPGRTSPGAGFTFAALGDMGTTDNARANLDAIDALDPAFVLHTGDISYAEGDQTRWHAWFEMVEPVASRLPWITALGNHEVGPIGVGNTGWPAEVAYYQQRFSLPDNELWYSFDWAGVHFVALDTFSQPDSPGPEQLTWLADDLAAAGDATWTVVFLHEPLYSSNNHGSAEDLQTAFNDLFDEHGVDLVVAGHDHGYERSYPLRGGASASDHADTYTEGEGVVHVVTGGGGQSLYTDWEDPAPRWSAAREALYHVTLFTVTDERIEGRVVPSAGGAFEDSFAILKPGGATGAAGGSEGASESPGLGPLVVLGVLAGIAMAARRHR